MGQVSYLKMKDINATKCAKTKIGGIPVMVIVLQLERLDLNQISM